ncbi:MAG: hypothetical protein IJV15_12715 [Lachnospiraceae bacterium]|nr:hypothetical protein [Lachnospiraceae bacterium]
MNFMNIMVIIFTVIAVGAGLIGYIYENRGANKNLKDDDKEEKDRKEKDKE